MKSSGESGHAINVANLDLILAEVASYGAAYNPTKASLTLPALTALSTASRNLFQAVSSSESAVSLAKVAREAAFTSLSPLVTKVISALKATDTTQQVDETARTLVRKIQGKRATPRKSAEEKQVAAEAGKEIVEISSSRMSFESRIENFDKLIQLLTAVPQYGPNEEELKISSLAALSADLKAKNSAVVTAEVALGNARIARNQLLYQPVSGVVDLALDAKNYVKSLFGTSSPQYKKLGSIRFTTPR